MEFTLKQKKLLVHLLNEKEYKTAEYFAEKLGFSVRTIYNDLHVVETYVEQFGVTLDKKPGVGLKVILDGKERLRLLGSINLHTNYVDRLSTEKRAQNIALRLLYADQPISMQEFSDIYFVSKTSIVKDIEKIEKTISPFQLEIHKNTKGIRVAGGERDIRRAIHAYIKTMAREEVEHEPAKLSTGLRLDAITYNQLLRFFDAKLICDTEKCFIRLAKSEGDFLSDIHYVNVLSHILILLKRVQLGKKNDYQHAHLSELKPLKAYLMAKEILAQLGSIYQLAIPENEISYLATYLLCCNLNDSEYAFSFDENFGKKIDDCVGQMCSIASNILSIDLTADQILKNGLKLHITPMLNRCKFRIKIDNPILQDIKEQYSSMFSIVQLLSVIVEDTFEIQTTQEETGYLTMHFAAAAERYLFYAPRKVLIVGYGGSATSQLLAGRIKQLIANVEIVAVVDAGRLHDIDLASVEFIVSAVNLVSAPKPVILISPLLTEKDVEKLNAYVWRLENNKRANDEKAAENNGEILSVIEEKFIYTGIEKRPKETILRELCRALENAECVEKEYFATVMDREKLSPTFVGNLVAIPHGEASYIHTEKIVLCLLDDAIEWGNGKVKLIVFIAIKTDDKERFKKILKSLYRLFDSKETMRQIMDAKQPEEIYETIKHMK